MCGIAGIWRLDRGETSDRERIARMADVLRHRGPDDFGYLLAESAGSGIQAGQSLAAAFVPDLLLASRRLSITDLSPDGRQPISNEAGDLHSFVGVVRGCGGGWPEVAHVGASLAEPGDQFLAQVEAGVITADVDFHRAMAAWQRRLTL